MRWLAIPLVGLVALTSPAMAADGLSLYAAGSLKAALTDVAKAYEEVYGAPIEMEFAASGLLPERIEGGEHADVFASANKAHPQALMAKGAGRTGRAVRAQPAVRSPSPTSSWTAPISSRSCCVRTSRSAPRRPRPIRPATAPGRFSRRRTRCDRAASRSSTPRP